jgi:hypothetical protein
MVTKATVATSHEVRLSIEGKRDSNIQMGPGRQPFLLTVQDLTTHAGVELLRILHCVKTWVSFVSVPAHPFYARMLFGFVAGYRSAVQVRGPKTLSCVQGWQVTPPVSPD